MVFPPQLQCFDFLQESFHQCYLQSLEDELVEILNNRAYSRTSSVKHGDHHLAFLNDPSLSNLLDISSNIDYDEEEYLFKQQEPILEEPLLPLDSTAEVVSSIASVEDVTSEEPAKSSTLEGDPLLDEIYHELNKELHHISEIKEPNTELINAEFQDIHVVEMQSKGKEDALLPEGQLQKSISSACLMSKDVNDQWPVRFDFVGFQEIGLAAVVRLRRAYSEGDIMTLDTRALQFQPVTCPPLQPCLLPMGSFKSEERMQKLFRYMQKKSKRNFGKKIKYACRKALADSQPRVRGRFAKSEE